MSEDVDAYIGKRSELGIYRGRTHRPDGSFCDWYSDDDTSRPRTAVFKVLWGKGTLFGWAAVFRENQEPSRAQLRVVVFESFLGVGKETRRIVEEITTPATLEEAQALLAARLEALATAGA